MSNEPVKQFYTWDQYASLVKTLKEKITKTPDFIVSIGKGGSIPGVILAEAFNVLNLNIGIKSYSNYTKNDIVVYQDIDFSLYRDYKILVVDDLTDSGNTLQYVEKMFLKNFCESIETSCVFIKSGSSYKPTYFAETVASDKWIVQPWEIL